MIAKDAGAPDFTESGCCEWRQFKCWQIPQIHFLALSFSMQIFKYFATNVDTTRTHSHAITDTPTRTPTRTHTRAHTKAAEYFAFLLFHSFSTDFPQQPTNIFTLLLTAA